MQPSCGPRATTWIVNRHNRLMVGVIFPGTYVVQHDQEPSPFESPATQSLQQDKAYPTFQNFVAAALATYTIWVVTFVDSTYLVAAYLLTCISTILIVFARPLANGIPDWNSGS